MRGTAILFIFLVLCASSIETFQATDLDNDVISESMDTVSVDGKVIMTLEQKYEDGLEVETSMIADEVKPSVSQYYTNQNGSGPCYSGTYYFGCDNIKIYTRVGPSANNFQQYFFFDLNQTAIGTTLSDIRPGYSKTYNVTITKPQYNSIRNISKSTSTRTIEYKTGVRSSVLGTTTITTGVQVTGREVRPYGS